MNTYWNRACGHQTTQPEPGTEGGITVAELRATVCDSCKAGRAQREEKYLERLDREMHAGRFEEDYPGQHPLSRRDPYAPTIIK